MDEAMTVPWERVPVVAIHSLVTETESLLLCFWPSQAAVRGSIGAARSPREADLPLGTGARIPASVIVAEVPQFRVGCAP